MPLSPEEKTQLAVVAQATLDVERERRSLDACGIRYLLSVRMAINHHERSGTTTPISGATVTPSDVRISFRNFVWALHSESQDMMLSVATQSCPNGKMLWDNAKRLGVFLWLHSAEAVVRIHPPDIDTGSLKAEITARGHCSESFHGGR